MSSSPGCTYVAWSDYDWHSPVQCNVTSYGPKIHDNPAVLCIIAAAHAVGLFVTMEVFIRTFVTFRNWRTLYFWTMLAASFGLGLSILTISLSTFVLPPSSRLLNAMSVIGSVIMSAGFLLVMWSRLHVVMTAPSHARLLKMILLGMITLAICIHTPELAAAVLRSKGHESAPLLSRIVSYLQITFLLEDLAMVALYIHHLRLYTLSLPAHTPPQSRTTIQRTYHTLLLFCVALLIDKIVLTTLLGTGLLLARTTVMSLMYPAVISLEFLFIRQTVKLAQAKSEVLRAGNLWMFEGQHKADIEVGAASSPAEGTSPCVSEDTVVQVSADSSKEVLSRMIVSKVRTTSDVSGSVDSIETLERQYLGKRAR